MFSKTSLAFLVIGALWVNVSAIPIPADGPPDGYELSALPGLSYDGRTQTPSVHLGDTAGSPSQGLGVNKKLLYWSELPRSFSALSYRDLTFVFSVVGGGLLGTGLLGGGIAAGLLSHSKGKNTTGTTDDNNNTTVTSGDINNGQK